jgi:hypothetical protein
MELGCGCGDLGKQLGRCVRSYLGVDYSTLALKIARLVSPPNCQYHHVSDLTRLAAHHGSIDTVVGRYFWIHQNLQLARENLCYLDPFLRPGSRVYADFFWPDPSVEQFVVLSPHDSLSQTYPSAMFKYEQDDVQALVAGSRFRIINEVMSRSMQRRYVTLECTR